MDPKTDGFGGQDSMGAPQEGQKDPKEVIANHPLTGEVTREQYEASKKYAEALIVKVKETVAPWDNDRIVRNIKAELNRAKEADMAGQLAFMLDMKEIALQALEAMSEAILFASSMEEVLRDRLGVSNDRCERKECDGCPVQQLIHGS